MSSNTYVISLGSNSQNKDEEIKLSVVYLKSKLLGLVVSDFYETPALNGKDAPYLNAVAIGTTDTDFISFNIELKEYEKERGRSSKSKELGIIPIDLDIVLCNSEILKSRDYNQEYFQKGWKQICQ